MLGKFCDTIDLDHESEFLLFVCLFVGVPDLPLNPQSVKVPCDQSRMGAFSDAAESEDGQEAASVKEEQLTPKDKASSEYRRVENLVEQSDLDISRLDEKKMKPPIRNMIKHIARVIPKDDRRRLPREVDGVKDLVRGILWNPYVRPGFSSLCNLLFVVIDCAGYLDVELFGEKCTGLTKVLQKCFGKLRY